MLVVFIVLVFPLDLESLDKITTAVRKIINSPNSSGLNNKQMYYWIVRTFHDREVRGGVSSELANTKSQEYYKEINCGHVCHLPSSVSQLCPQAWPGHRYSAYPGFSSHIWMRKRKDPALHRGLYLGYSFNLSVRKAFF